MRVSQTLCVLFTVLVVGAAIGAGCGRHESAPMSRAIIDNPAKRNPLCAATLPTNGTACAGAAFCEYDPDAFGFATDWAACNCDATGCQWFVPLMPAPPSMNPAACPETYADALTLASCPLTGNVGCSYDEGVCGCTSCGWRCRARTDVGVDNGPPGATCPPFEPLSGDACAPEGVICHYEHSRCPPDPLDLGKEMSCSRGYWGPAGGGGVGGCQQSCATSP